LGALPKAVAKNKDNKRFCGYAVVQGRNQA